MDNAAADLTCTTDETDVEFRGVLQDPEVLSPSTKACFEDRNISAEACGGV